jgi:ferrous iron transport protein B
MSGTLTLALAGNPNAGKTSIFNALTGSHQHVGNWPGKTVAKFEGSFRHRDIVGRLIDLPGTYSMSAFSPEEIITRDYLLSREPSVVINVVDATNLERNLYLTSQLLEVGIPLVLALNVMDSARSKGIRIDTVRLSQLLGGSPIVETVGHRGQGMAALVAAAIGLVGDDGAQLRLVA